ncbi:MAG: PD-(D/E)XK nuclease family protein, partial [Flavobacteriales bacterium]|nr:PD-(D/E)XK nuclease family protein [Flavobacteriales bacterium]
HRVLDKFYPLGILTDKIIKNIAPQILEDIEGEFASELSHQAVKEGKNYLNIQIAKKLTADFLELERKLIKKVSAENKSVKVIGKEVELCYSISVDDTDFKLIGNVDRIDLEGEVLRIIDYKTGKVTDKDLTFTEYDEIIDNVDKSKAFQLLMYAFLYLKNNQQFADLDVIAGNYSFKNLKTGLLKVSKKIGKSNTETVRINNNVLDEIQQQIIVVLTKIKNNPFTQTTELKNCEWCDYKSICKR